MNETLFFILGIGLVVAALLVSALGLRFQGFPPSGAPLLGLVVAFVVVVGGTMVFAWRNAEDEQADREAEGVTIEQAEPSGEVIQEENTPADTATGEPGTATTTAEGTTTTTASADGAQLFESQGCTGCHTLAAAGSTATTGPVLDSALKGESKQFISTSITDPNADIAKGYPPNVMPQSFGQSMTPEELSALVDYLDSSVNGKG
jgi:mono/diheme cytochrome c family protein